IWFAAQMSDAASCAFNETRLLHLRGPLQVGALRAALQQLVDRHEALRTTFAPAGETQTVQRALKVDLPLLDWAKLEAPEGGRRLNAALAREAGQPFDLIRGPLLRARLIRLDGQTHVLLLTVHHIICDGHSLGIVLRELRELYTAACHNARL